MKIAINAVSAKMGGAVTYLTNILRHLPSAESGLEFVVFLPPETAEKQRGLAPNIRLVPTNIGCAKWWKRLWWEQIALRRYLRQQRADALFSTANFGMFLCPVPQILLVRISLYFSKTYQERFLRPSSPRSRASLALRRWLCCQSVQWADIVMAPTEAMLEDLRGYVEVPSSKALVNHYGVAIPEGAEVGRPLSGDADGPVRLLYISLYAKHKNLTTLLKAMALLGGGPSRRFVLFTTVNPAWKEAGGLWARKEDLELLQDRSIASCVQLVGPLGPIEIEEQYRDADIFVFPSLVESFGHPMAEAMAHGLPIVAADTPVNRELCGDAALYFRPLDPDHLAQTVRQVAMDDSLRSRMAHEGWRRARERFRWDQHVRRILLAIERDIAGSPFPASLNTVQRAFQERSD